MSNYNINTLTSLLVKACEKVDSSKYRPGHRLEKIHGWFYTYLEETFGQINSKEFISIVNMPELKSVPFNYKNSSTF